ncbi:hypothetical protein CDEST_11515 [Colletotrichum destructivum]|uniref:Uncharacterized protein n=1 Tax=Colletotrichum destructivum TaxID=34406 RepID=A0AAX4ITL0_9PEZI|nr:hypothetical protein CDEST_11515 [Colletotrichum destructivum]
MLCLPDGAVGRGSFATLPQRPMASPTPHSLLFNGFSISSRGPRPFSGARRPEATREPIVFKGPEWSPVPPLGEWKFCVGWTSRWLCLDEDVVSFLAE